METAFKGNPKTRDHWLLQKKEPGGWVSKERQGKDIPFTVCPFLTSELFVPWQLLSIQIYIQNNYF